jgi:hypothetical protein
MIKRATAATMLIMLLGSSCKAAPDVMPPQSPVASAAQSPACTVEAYPVPAECVVVRPLPWCLQEDDAIDGVTGPACYWRDPSSGAIWFNDGDGTRS